MKRRERHTTEAVVIGVTRTTPTAQALVLGRLPRPVRRQDGRRAAPLQLARLTSVSQASVSTVLNTLERKGLVRRSRSDKDGRSVTIELTDYGHEVVGELFARNNAREAEWARALTARERGTLIRLLRKIRRHEVSTVTDGTRLVNGDTGTP
ncbi:MarR family winged helix-turn-helix transcriptional regulator [Streptomyces sp. NBC_01235]|uniref:MarR family winged helix-turn-helix transcriptional regulator n=1 Tax=Streptomyces sp. NBC_01235 TaxID=2903788 RepID=UPI002E1669A1